MSGSLNRVMIIGNLGKDPEVRTFGNGGKVASFSVACSETWKDKNTGEKREKTEWINVSCFGDGLVRVIEQYVHKGTKVYVEGKFSTRKWQDKDGNDRYSTEVVVQGFDGRVMLLGEKGGGGGGERREREPERRPGDDGYSRSSTSGSNFNGGGGRSGGFVDDLDDDVPF